MDESQESNNNSQESNIIRICQVLNIRKAVETKAGTIDYRGRAGVIAIVGSIAKRLPSPSNAHPSNEHHGNSRKQGQSYKLRLHSNQPRTVVLLFADARTEYLRRKPGKPNETSDTYDVASLIKFDTGTTVLLPCAS
jgi:hypothetical protein